MSTSQVKELRERTGAGIMECKRALEETNGNLDKAAELLRKQGLAKAEKKVGREARQGLVESYIHAGGRIGAMVEVNCETDFVARTDDFRTLVRDVAMQVAAMNPKYVTVDEIPSEARQAGLTEYGDEKRFYEAEVLLRQPFIKDQRRAIEDLVRDAIAKLGENIVVRRFARFELGETAADETAAA